MRTVNDEAGESSEVTLQTFSNNSSVSAAVRLPDQTVPLPTPEGSSRRVGGSFRWLLVYGLCPFEVAPSVSAHDPKAW